MAKSFKGAINKSQNTELKANNPALQFFTGEAAANDANKKDDSANIKETNKEELKKIQKQEQEIPDSTQAKEPPPIFVELAGIAVSDKNVRYKLNIDNYDQALIILRKLQDIDPNLLATETGLSNALASDEDSDFYKVLNEYKKQAGALNLLGLAGAIRSEGQLNPPPVRPVESKEKYDREINYVLIDGMRRYLSMKLLQERFMFVHVRKDLTLEDDEKISNMANMQIQKQTDYEFGQSLAKRCADEPWKNQQQIAAEVGISRAQLRRYLGVFDAAEKSKEDKVKPEKKIKQVIMDDERGVLTFTGTAKISPQKVDAIRAIMEDEL